LPHAVREISGNEWRVTSSPHHNHQDTPEYEVATLLWFDQHLKGEFEFPQTPECALKLAGADGVPTFTVQPDRSKSVLSVDVFYTQHGKSKETPQDREDTTHRFWHHASATAAEGIWTAKLPLSTTDKPLWVYANVAYPLDAPVTGAGYYYRTYTATSYNVSSLLRTATAAELRSAGMRATRPRSLLIEDFGTDWEKEWFTYRPEEWSRATHKIHDETWKAPDNAALALEVLADERNTLVVLIDGYAAEIPLHGDGQWQEIILTAGDFRDLAGASLPGWETVKQLKLSAAERLQPKRGEKREARIVGKNWRGERPQFRNLRWHVASTGS
jgi:hypothetical protein